MRIGTITFVVAVVTAVLSCESGAKMYARGHHFCGYGPYYDYSQSNALSPYSYIYPAANWGPFFQCRMYYSPVSGYQGDLF